MASGGWGAPSARPSNSVFSSPSDPSTQPPASIFGIPTAGVLAQAKNEVQKPASPDYPEDVKRKLKFADSLTKRASDTSTPNCSFSDFEIVSGDSRYPVHRVIISLHSGYFKRICENNKFKEGPERTVVLEEDSDLAVLSMIQYFYGFDYDDPGAKPPSPPCTLGEKQNKMYLHSTVFTIADKYDVPDLKELAWQKFEAMTRMPFPGNFGFSMDQTYRNLAADLVETIPHIYAYTPLKDSRLRELAVTRFTMESKKLFGYTDKVAFDKMLLEVPEFACELIPALVETKMICTQDLWEPGQPYVKLSRAQ